MTGPLMPEVGRRERVLVTAGVLARAGVAPSSHPLLHCFREDHHCELHADQDGEVGDACCCCGYPADEHGGCDCEDEE